MIPQIVAEPDIQRFGPSQDEDLYRALCELDDATFIEPIMDVSDIHIKPNGCRDKDDAMFSRQAFKTLCERVAPGLSTLAMDVGGIKRRLETVDEVVSPELALLIVNACSKLRFRIKDGLYNRQLIIHGPRGVIDGIIGPKYRYLSHRTLFESVDEMLSGTDPPSTFHNAILHGRHLSMVWSIEGDLFTLSNGHTYRGGYYFSNSEGGGTGVHAAATIGIVGTPMRCVSELHNIAHSGKGFGRRLGQLLSGVLVRAAEEIERIRGFGEALLGNDLLVYDPERHAVRDARQRELEEILTARAIPRTDIKDIVRRAIFVGSVDGDMPDRIRPEDLSKRRQYDVLVCLMRYAVNCQPSTREKIERAAFDLITGKFDL
jgi:hypothetical protein